jgi:hypothetical protein
MGQRKCFVCGDGSRHRVANDDVLKASALNLVGQVTSAWIAIGHPIPVYPTAPQCRPCGMREHFRRAHE